MNLSEQFVVRNTNHFFDSVVEARENCKDRTHGKNVMKVSNDVVSIMKGNIQAGVGKNNSGDTSDGEEEDETKSKEKRSLKIQ